MMKECPLNRVLPPDVVECAKCKYHDEKYTDDQIDLLKISCTVSDYINFGDFCRKELNCQCQYGYYMLEGLAGHPVMGEGLRIKGENDGGNYHEYLIHKDDALIFKDRVEKWRTG